MKACLDCNIFYEALDFSNIKHSLDTEEKITMMFHYMDRNAANLIGFLWLRRLNYAWATCSNGVMLNAVIQIKELNIIKIIYSY